MKLIVGLGNPGKDYENTRHNTGFMVLDRLSEKLNIEMTQSKFKGLYGKSKYKGEDVILLKPQTMQTLSDITGIPLLINIAIAPYFDKIELVVGSDFALRPKDVSLPKK